MEQNNYKLEIIEKLLLGKNHVRNLAKELKTNHMNVQRKIKELEKENVVDYKEEGKNKAYFLKNTIEARSYVFKAENYKLIKLVRKNPELRVIIDSIQKEGSIKLAVLFGSYSKGISRKESDIDIYIETEDRKIKERIERIDSKISVKIGKYDKSSLLIREIEKNHVILKGVEIYYEKNKFFEQA